MQLIGGTCCRCPQPTNAFSASGSLQLVTAVNTEKMTGQRVPADNGLLKDHGGFHLQLMVFQFSIFSFIMLNPGSVSALTVVLFHIFPLIFLVLHSTYVIVYSVLRQVMVRWGRCKTEGGTGLIFASAGWPITDLQLL